MRRVIKAGQEFDRLTVTGEFTKPSGAKACVCDCSCGRKGFVALKHNLIAGTTRSCSCWRSERLRERMSKFADPEIPRRLVRAFREQGFSVREIGSKIGLTGGRVHQMLMESKH